MALKILLAAALLPRMLLALDANINNCSEYGIGNLQIYEIIATINLLYCRCLAVACRHSFR